MAVERQSMHDEKVRIGKLAASLIEPEDTIMVDTGTTTEQLLQYLRMESRLLSLSTI